MWNDIKENYRSAWTFSAACPLLFLVPPLFEFAQHVAEVRIGMYDGPDAAQAVAMAPLRLDLGFLKTLALLLPGYWYVRYLSFNHDPSAARKLDLRALGLWFVIFAISSAFTALALFGPELDALTGLDRTKALFARGTLSLIQLSTEMYLSAWIVAWPLGKSEIGPLTSFGIMTGHFWRAMLYFLAGFLPLTAIHYALGIGAIGRPTWLIWLMLTADAAVVGGLALTLAGATYFAARHAARAKGVSLLPE